jgi:phosphoenolpyruvate---glycerone phosphotransferase subunit DhaL
VGIRAKDARAWVERSAQVIAERREELTELDSAIGDADHGANMHRGFQAVLERFETSDTPADPGAVFKMVGTTLLSKVGGASGPLYGTFFMRMAGPLAGKPEAGPEDWSDALRAGAEGVRARGKAERGDKTMLDALLPAADALEAALGEGASFGDALRRSAQAAADGVEATIPLVARKGRASYLGERSAGHPDPGATSSHLLLDAAAESFR